jgi:hypothetical protein
MRRFYQEVIVCGHQTIGMHLYLIALHRLTDILQKPFPVSPTLEYIHSRVSAIHHVIESTRKFYS